MYYENKREKKFRGLAVFIAMLVIIVLLIALNLRLEGIQNLRKWTSPKLFSRKTYYNWRSKRKESRLWIHY